MMQIAFSRFKDFLKEQCPLYECNIKPEFITKDMMVLFVDYLQSRSVGEGAKSIYQRFKKVIRYAIEHDVILKDLTYKNVDYSNKLLKFEQNKTKGHSSASGVVIPLNDGLVSIIGEPLADGNKDVLIFNLPSYESCCKSVKRWVKRSGIDKHISWHCARHSFAVNILNNGANIKTVASLLGHSGLKHTEKCHSRHAVSTSSTLCKNLALTSRNWLMGCYIVEFEQNGEDRAAYGEQLLKKLEKQLNTKGLNKRRFREFRRLYLVYPQLKEEVLGYVMSGSGIRRLPTAEFETEIRRSVTAKLQMVSEIANNDWKLAAEKLFNRLSSTHLNAISAIDNPIKRAFYEMETIRGCWTAKELERQIDSLYYERSGFI